MLTREREPLGSIADCTPVERFGGEGRETVVARLKGWRFTAHRVANQVSFVAAPGDAGLGATADVRVDRRGAERVEEVAGTCMGNPGRVTEAGPFDCGARNRPMNVQLLWRRGRLAVALADSGLAPLGRTTFESCPIHAHERVRDNGLTEISEALPAGDLFDPELKQHIVLARRMFRLDAGGYRGAATVRWQVKLTRRGAIR